MSLSQGIREDNRLASAHPSDFARVEDVPRVLVPIDETPGSTAILDVLTRLHRDRFLALLVHVSESDAEGPAETARERRSWRRLEEQADRLRRRGISSEFHLERGRPVATILDAASELDADGIALATHGRTGLSRLLSGSVTESILRRTYVPVLVANEDALLRAAPLADEPVRRLLVPVESRAGYRVVEPTVVGIARDHGCRVVLFHAHRASVALPGPMHRPSPVHRVHREEIERPAFLAPLAETLRERGIDVQVTSPADEAVLRRMASNGTDLAVMASRGRRGVSRWLLGSTTESILRRASCPVLVHHHDGVDRHPSPDEDEREGEREDEETPTS